MVQKKTQAQIKEDITRIHKYPIPVCLKCSWQLRGMFDRVRVCMECWHKSISQNFIELWSMIKGKSLNYFLLCVEKVWWIDNLFEIVSSFWDRWIKLSKQWTLAGSLPWVFWRVKKGIWITEFNKRSNLYLFHKAGIPFDRDELYHALVEFYTFEKRKIYHQTNNWFLKPIEDKTLDLAIKSYIHIFMITYYPLYKRFTEWEIDVYDSIAEPVDAEISWDNLLYILNPWQKRVSKIMNILKFCSTKKLAKDMVSPLTRKLSIIYDLPLEHLYDDLQCERPPSN